MVEEEVVQLVGSDQFLGLLRDLPRGLRGQQLGTHGRVAYVVKDGARAAADAVGLVAHQVQHEGLGHRGVQAVHRHLVAVVGGPAQRQLAQVARADHQSPLHVGRVHQNLGPLAGLGVLVGRRAVRGVKPDVGEVLFARLADGYFACRDAQFAHQLHGVAVRARAGAEARHGDADDAPAVEAEAVERAHGCEQRQRRVQTARNADHRLAACGVFEAAGQAAALDGEDLLAPLAAVRVVRHEGQRGERTFERRRTQALGDLQLDDRGVGRVVRGAVGGGAAACGGEEFEVHVGRHELFFGGKALRLAQDRAVLGHEGLAREHQVGGRLARAGRAVDVGRHRAGRLLRYQAAHVGVLPGRLGRCREVEHHACARRRQVRRGGRGDPQVLAELDGELRAVHLEGEVAAEVGLAAAEPRRVRRHGGARREPAGFVELAVVGDVRLRHQSHDAALRQHRGAVVDRVAVAHGQARDDRQRQLARPPQQLLQGLLGGVEQRGLQKEVAARVARERQFGENDDFDAPLCGLLREGDVPLGVASAVRHVNMRYGSRHPQKTVLIHR